MEGERGVASLQPVPQGGVQGTCRHGEDIWRCRGRSCIKDVMRGGGGQRAPSTEKCEPHSWVQHDHEAFAHTCTHTHDSTCCGDVAVTAVGLCSVTRTLTAHRRICSSACGVPGGNGGVLRRYVAWQRHTTRVEATNGRGRHQRTDLHIPHTGKSKSQDAHLRQQTRMRVNETSL